MNNLKLLVNKKEIEVPSKTTLEEISKQFKQDYKYEIIIAKVDGIYKELSDTINKECTIEFFDLSERGSNSIYLNGLVFLTIYSFKQLFGNMAKIKVKHSLDKGLYIETIPKIQKEDIERLTMKMNEIIAQKIPIQKVTVSRLEAINYFKEVGDNTKSEIMKYITSTHLSIYKLGNMYNYFYSLMPTNTSMLSNYLYEKWY